MRSMISPAEFVVVLHLTVTKVYSALVAKSGSTLTALPCLQVSTLLSCMRMMISLGSALPAYPDPPVLLLPVLLARPQMPTAQL